MDTNSAKILEKRDKLLRYPKKFRSKPADLPNLKNITKLVRYTLKYLTQYPAEFKGVFCSWISLTKDFVSRSDISLQLQCATQITVVLMHAVRIKFNPIYDLEEILEQWIDLLVTIPTEVTTLIVERNSSRMHYLIKTLKYIGHYKLQSLLVEILIRYLICLDDDVRHRMIKDFFSSERNNTELVAILTSFDTNYLEMSIRLFLNEFNSRLKTNVFTYEVLSISTNDGSIINPPTGSDKQWIDVNLRASCLSFYGYSDSPLWNYFETTRDSVAAINKEDDCKLSIELNHKLLINFCPDDEQHKKYGDITSIQIAFATNDALDKFLTTTESIFNPSSEERQIDLVAEPNDTLNTLNLSMISQQSFHNGDLDARFSFRGDTDDEAAHEEESESLDQRTSSLMRRISQRSIPELRQITKSTFNTTEQQDAIPPPAAASPIFVPTKTTEKRKLYSGEAYESIIPQSQSQVAVEEEERAESPNTSSDSMQIVMHEEDLVPKRKNTTRDSSTANASLSASRVPIYRTVLEDWKSQADPYEFVSNDPPPGNRRTTAAAARKTRKPPLSNLTLKKQRCSGFGGVSKRSKSVVKRGPVLKKLPLDFVQRIVKKPCKEAAQEAKRVFGLPKTPPYHGCEDKATNEESVVDHQQSDVCQQPDVTCPVEITRDSAISDDSKMLRTMQNGNYSGFNQGRHASSLMDMTTVEPVEQDDMESYAVFMKCIEEYRTINMQMGDVMRAFRKLKQKITNSAKLTEYQKAGLLVELCNFLLKK